MEVKYQICNYESIINSEEHCTNVEIHSFRFRTGLFNRFLRYFRRYFLEIGCLEVQRRFTLKKLYV